MTIDQKNSDVSSLLDLRSMMPIAKIISLICFCVLVLVVPAAAQTFTYYVDSGSGSDSNPGSEGSPWRTIAKVNGAQLGPGQSVGFKRGGMWREALVVSHSGTAGNAITFGAYGTGSLPIIDGSDVFSSGWTAYSGGANIWQHAFAPSNISHAYVFFNGVAGGPHGGIPQSSIANITARNEWYWDGRGTLYVYSTSNPATAFTSPGVEATMRVGVQAPTRSFITFQNLAVRKTSQSCFDLYQVTHTSVLSSTVSYCGNSGIAFYGGSNYASIGQNTVSYAAASDIQVNSSSYAQIYLNDVSHAGILSDDSEGIGIWGNGGNNYIYFNYAHDNTDQTGPAGVRGIEIDTITPPNINYVHDNTVTRSNASGIIVETSSNQMVWNNLSYDNAHGVGANCCVGGIKDNDGAGNMFYGNTTFGNEFGEFLVTNNGGVGPIVKDNLFYASPSAAAAIFTNGGGGATGTYDYNLVYGSNTLYSFGGPSYSASTFFPSTGQGQHDVHANPLLTSAPNSFIQSLGFALGAGSPAIGKGVYINGVSTSNPPNIGAH